MSQDSRNRESRAEIPLGRGPRAIGTGEKPKNAQRTVRRLWGYLRQQRLGLLCVFLLVVAGTAFDSLGP